MLVNTNRAELMQLARYFYNITKTLITIYDAEMRPITSYPNTMCEFCTAIRTVPQLHSQCIMNDNRAFEVCKKTRKTHIYQCHMGLVEVATPIVYNNLIVGYMLFGQISQKQSKEEILQNIRNLPEEYGFNKEELLRAAEKIRTRSKDYIESIAALVEMCANYIWLNNIISVRNDGLAHNITLYIKEHLSEELSVPLLCEEFHIGRSKLYEISQSHYGCSISEYLRLTRLKKAEELLTDLSVSVAQVAEAVGFRDVNYFIRFFKKHKGITPKKYQTGQTKGM